ncbi:MAG: YcxB family protein [Ruminococcus sp.]|nr:YcxB family protein [Ruminococcus sp.]
MAERILLQISCPYSSAGEYIKVAGSVYSRKNKLFPIALITLVMYCVVCVFLPINRALRYEAMALLIFIAVYSKALSYLTAAIQLLKNKEDILGSPGTYIFYEENICEYTANGRQQISYSDIKDVTVTDCAIAVFAGDIVMMIPGRGLTANQVRDILKILSADHTALEQKRKE